MAQDLVINGKTFEDVKQLAAKNANGETVIYSESDGGGSGLLQSKSVQPGKDQQIVTPDTGYYGLESVTVTGDENLSAENIKAGVNIFGVSGNYESEGASGEQATPEINVSGSGLITATAGDKSATKQLDTVAGKTVTPGTEDQTVVPAERFTTGDVIVKGDANLVPSNIAKDVTIFGVTGEHEGEGGGEQATPEISVDENGLITATAGDKTATEQLPTQSGKTITPGATEQIAVAAGKYVTGDVIVAAVENTGGGGEQGSAIIIDGPNVTMSGETSISVKTPIFEYQVVPVEGATYGFALNDSGYYESQNKGKANSYAMCKVVFNSNYYKVVRLLCINYAQKGYDFGLISNVDTMLSMDNVEDSDGVFKSFVSTNSSGTNTLSITIPAGEHFICIKFIKNGSTNSNNDSLQFMVTY